MTETDFNIVGVITIFVALGVYYSRAKEFNFLAYLIIYGICFWVVSFGYWLTKLIVTY